MVKREELQHKTHAATAVAALAGTVVPANMRRYIYKIKTVNQFAGANRLQISYGTLLVVTAAIDYVDHATQYETWVDPDELKDDSAPLYILEAGTYLWLGTNNGNCQVTVWYIDAP